MSSLNGTVDYCNFDDHLEYSEAARNALLYLGMILVLCSVDLAQSLRGFGHAFAYMIAFALCAFALKMMPHALGWYVMGSAAAPSVSSLEQLLNGPMWVVGNAPSGLMLLAFQWFGTIAAGAVINASGTQVWFENLLIRFFSGRKSRYMLPTTAACLGVMSALCVGTDAVNMLYISPLLNAAKVIGQRPSKSLSALVIGGLLGAACSPINPAVQYYYNQFLEVTDLETLDYSVASLLSYDNAALILIPSAVVGALVAGVTATFLGRDLETSETYRKRQELGLVSQPGEEEFREVVRLASAETGERAAATSPVAATKLEKAFSLQSRLEEGDFVYTNARYRDGSYVDMNDRQGEAAASRKSVTIKDGGSRRLEEAPAEESETSSAAGWLMRPQPLRNSKAQVFTALGVFVAGGVFILIWGILKGVPQTEDGSDYIVPLDRPLPTSLAYAILFAALSGVVMLVNRIKAWELTRGTFFKSSVVGVVGALSFTALGSSWLQDWDIKLSCVAYSSESSVKHYYTWIFWTFLTSVFTGNEAMTHIRLARGVSALPNLFDRVRWIAAAFPMAIGNFVFPTNANMIIISELDDTGSTRLGWLVLDHAFIIPGLLGMASAFGLAYAISVGIFP